MSRTNLVLGGVAGVSFVCAVWMYIENRELTADLESSRRDIVVAEDKLREASDPWAAERSAGPRTGGSS